MSKWPQNERQKKSDNLFSGCFGLFFLKEWAEYFC
jgi:hypothetical protein